MEKYNLKPHLGCVKGDKTVSDGLVVYYHYSEGRGTWHCEQAILN